MTFNGHEVSSVTTCVGVATWGGGFSEDYAPPPQSQFGHVNFIQYQRLGNVYLLVNFVTPLITNLHNVQTFATYKREVFAYLEIIRVCMFSGG